MIPRIVYAIFVNGVLDFENNSKIKIKTKNTRFIKRNLKGIRFMLANATDKKIMEPMNIPIYFWGNISLDFTRL